MIGKPAEGTAPPDDAAFAEAHRALLSDGSIQLELPQPDPPPEPPAWLKWLADQLSNVGPFDAPDWLDGIADFFDGVAPGLGTAFYVVLGAVVAAALFFIARFVIRRLRGRAAPELVEADWRPEETVALGLLGDADALAARGLFSEAVHLLLFRSIEDIDSRRPELVRRSLTSRDIAALEPIPMRPRSAFARIAMSVERSLFGQRPLGENEWRDCRSAYEDFAFADGWQR